MTLPYQLELSVAVFASFVFSKAASNLCLSRLRERQLQPSLHHKSIAITVCWFERISISLIACNLSSMPLLGCCATGENTTTARRSSVMFYTGFQFPFELSSRSACWSTSRFMGQCLGICATIVRRRIRPLRGYDFERRINAIFLLDGRLGLVTAPSQLLAPDAGTSFLLLCVQPIQSILLKLDLRPTCSAKHIPLLVDCKAPL